MNTRKEVLRMGHWVKWKFKEKVRNYEGYQFRGHTLGERLTCKGLNGS